MVNKQEYAYFNVLNTEGYIFVLKADGYLYQNGNTKITSVGNVKMFYDTVGKGIILTNDGKVYTTTNSFRNATLVPSLSDKKIVWVGGDNVGKFAITEDNKIYVWGANLYGCLGLGHSSSVSEPTLLNLPNNEKPFMVLSSYASAAIVTITGNLYVSGYLNRTHISGSVTYNTFTKSNISNVTHISMSNDSSSQQTMYAITANGDAYVIGSASPGVWKKVTGISNARFTFGFDTDNVACMIDSNGYSYYVNGYTATKLNIPAGSVGAIAKGNIMISTPEGQIYSGGYTSPSLNSTYSSNAAKPEIRIDGLFVQLPKPLDGTYDKSPNGINYKYCVRFIQTDQITETSNVVNYETCQKLRLLMYLYKILIISIFLKTLKIRVVS